MEAESPRSVQFLLKCLRSFFVDRKLNIFKFLIIIGQNKQFEDGTLGFPILWRAFLCIFLFHIFVDLLQNNCLSIDLIIIDQGLFEICLIALVPYPARLLFSSGTVPRSQLSTLWPQSRYSCWTNNSDRKIIHGILLGQSESGVKTWFRYRMEI